MINTIQHIKPLYLRILLLIVGAFLFYAAIYQVFYRIDAEPVKIWDEASTAKNAIEMYHNHNYLVVYTDGKPEHHDTRPPMAVWTKVLSFHMFGINELGVRVPTVVAVFLTYLIIVFFLWKVTRDYRSIYAFLILASTTFGFNFYHIARTGDPDALLTLFTTTYILGYFWLIEVFPKNKIFLYFIISLAILGAVFTKSYLGLAPLAGLLIYNFTQRNGYKLVKDPLFHLTWVTSVLVIAGYYFLREQYDPGYIDAVKKMEFNVINKPLMVKHPEFEYYFNYLWTFGFFPYLNIIWVPIIPLLFSKNQRIRRLLLFSFLGGIIFLLGESSVTIKNEWYIAPAYTFLWIFLSVGMVETITILCNLIKKKWTTYAINIVTVGALLYYSIPQYFEIVKLNTANQYAYEYPPEREGKFLDQTKQLLPEIKDLIIISPHPNRQMKFYERKYYFQDSTKVTYYFNMPKVGLINQNVLICEDSLETILESRYEYEILNSAKYCKLYKVLDAKMKTSPMVE